VSGLRQLIPVAGSAPKLSPVAKWWCDRLARRDKFKRVVKVSDLVDELGLPLPRRSVETSLGLMLRQCTPDLWKHRSVGGAVYYFPTLAECRVGFAAYSGMAIDWEKQATAYSDQ
jgi:hypothetical protein